MPYANKEDRRAFDRRRRDRIREIKKKAKDKPCADCGIKYPHYVMQFDHVRGEKVIAIGSATARIRSATALLQEIAKCDVVCGNCHAERTLGPTN